MRTQLECCICPSPDKELNGKNCISNLIGSGSFSHSAGMGKTGNSQSEGRDWSKEQNKSSSGKAGEEEDLQRNTIKGQYRNTSFKKYSRINRLRNSHCTSKFLIWLSMLKFQVQLFIDIDNVMIASSFINVTGIIVSVMMKCH